MPAHFYLNKRSNSERNSHQIRISTIQQKKNPAYQRHHKMSGVLPGYFFTHHIPNDMIYDRTILIRALNEIYGPSNYMLTLRSTIMVVETTKRIPEQLKKMLLDQDKIRDPSCQCDNCQRMIEDLKKRV